MSRKKPKKTKDKALSFRRVMSNNFFVLKIVQRIAPWYLLTYFLWSVLNAVMDFLGETYLLRYIVNSMEDGIQTEKILLFILTIVLLQIISAFLIALLRRFYYPRCNQRIVAALEKMLFEKAKQVEIACYEQPEFYDKYVRSMENIYSKCMDVVNNIDGLIWSLLYLSMNSFLLYIIDPMLIVFGLIPFAIGLLRRLRNHYSHKYDMDRNPIDRKKNYVQRTFYLSEYAKEMRLGRMARLMFRRQKEAFEDYRRLIKKYGLILGLLDFVVDTGVDVVAVMGAIVYAAWRTIVKGLMKLGDCIVVLNSVSAVSWLLSNLVERLNNFRKNALYVEDFRFFLDHEPAIADSEDAVDPTPGDLTVRDLSFTYLGAEKPSLNRLNFTIRSGEKIALVGHNGSGKTTLVKLLLRLYDPTEGSILMDGRDIRTLSAEKYRKLFGTVFQDFRIFSLSVAENVLLRPLREGDEERVIEALKKSGGYEKVASFERGIHTTLTREFDDQGVNLSGGEAQKITLARIFAEPAPYIILDEPSSALDPIAEYEMFQNMVEAGEGRTMIFISHRLSCAALADRVFYMEGGEIREMGTHDELMKAGGSYAELFRMQAENYMDGEDAPAEGGDAHV